MKPIIPKVSVITQPGEIFASAITSDGIAINNFQVLSFIIASGAGTSANTTVTVQAKAGSGAAENVDFLYKEIGATGAPTVQKTKTISVGGATNGKAHIVSITADMLAGTGYDTILIKTTAIASSTVPGSITAIQENPRYSE